MSDTLKLFAELTEVLAGGSTPLVAVHVEVDTEATEVAVRASVEGRSFRAEASLAQGFARGDLRCPDSSVVEVAWAGLSSWGSAVGLLGIVLSWAVPTYEPRLSAPEGGPEASLLAIGSVVDVLTRGGDSRIFRNQEAARKEESFHDAELFFGASAGGMGLFGRERGETVMLQEAPGEREICIATLRDALETVDAILSPDEP